MRKILFLATIAAIVFASCNTTPKGSLIGIYSKVKSEEVPYGMSFIPRGSFVMGPNDQSISWAVQPSQKTVSVEAFWMDQTEITNGEYKQFVYWVRDSIAIKGLIEVYQDDERKLKEFAKLKTGFKRQFRDEGLGEEFTDTLINWSARIPWHILRMPNIREEDKEAYAVLDNMFYSQDNSFSSDRQLNTQNLNYSYSWVDFEQASKVANTYDPYTGTFKNTATVFYEETSEARDTIITRTVGGQLITDTVEKFIRKKVGRKPLVKRSDLISRRTINIYPDTMCWMREFTHAYNEPYMHNYFAHPGYGEYPVVGVSWDQAMAFCNWRTKLHQAENKTRIQEYRLPTESEWEYAARGGLNKALYPWGGPFIKDARGCYMANFKPLRGNYVDDDFLIAARVASFRPNNFGLYDMAGNVSEWTSTTYNPAHTKFTSDINPSYEYKAIDSDPDALKRKVIRGGSWKDIGAYLQCGVRDYEYQDKRSPAIGFRCVRTYVGN